MFIAMSPWSGLRPLASATPSTLDPLGETPLRCPVAQCHGDPAALVLKDQPPSTLQQSLDGVDEEMSSSPGDTIRFRNAPLCPRDKSHSGGLVVKVIPFTERCADFLTDYPKNVLTRYLKYTLDQHVENDYTIVYFHYGLNSQNKPSLGWLQNAYKEFDR
ncbi:hypothetical protein STEG23_034635, partial [Scotinomys teguina]